MSGDRSLNQTRTDTMEGNLRSVTNQRIRDDFGHTIHAQTSGKTGPCLWNHLLSNPEIYTQVYKTTDDSQSHTRTSGNGNSTTQGRNTNLRSRIRTRIRTEEKLSTQLSWWNGILHRNGFQRIQYLQGSIPECIS